MRGTGQSQHQRQVLWTERSPHYTEQRLAANWQTQVSDVLPLVGSFSAVQKKPVEKNHRPMRRPWPLRPHCKLGLGRSHTSPPSPRPLKLEFLLTSAWEGAEKKQDTNMRSLSRVVTGGSERGGHKNQDVTRGHQIVSLTS